MSLSLIVRYLWNIFQWGLSTDNTQPPPHGTRQVVVPYGAADDAWDVWRFSWSLAGHAPNFHIVKDILTGKPAIFSVVGHIKHHNFELTSSPGQAMIRDSHGVSNLKLFCSVHKPAQSGPLADAWNQAMRQINLVLGRKSSFHASDGSQADLNACALVHKDGLKLQHPFTGGEYFIINKYNIHGDHEYTAVRDLMPDSFTSFAVTWEDSVNPEAQFTIPANPILAYDTHGDLISPQDYEKELSGKLVRCEFTLLHFGFTRTGHQAFVARIKTLRVVDHDSNRLTDDGMAIAD